MNVERLSGHNKMQGIAPTVNKYFLVFSFFVCFVVSNKIYSL